MRLIEKACPNCGAPVSFTKEDTTCKCEYCKREFEIERDTEKKKLDDQFILNELKTPFKIFSYITFGSFISHAVVVFVTFIIIIIVAFNLIKGLSDSNSMFNRNAYYVENVNDLSSSDYSTLDINSSIAINKATMGNTNGFVNKGSFKREKLYIISKKKRNYIIPVYKATYSYYSNSDIKYDVYMAVIYKNVRSKNNSIAYTLDDPEVVDTIYNFNEGGYTYGYDSIESLYNDIIKYYEEKNFKIVEK